MTNHTHLKSMSLHPPPPERDPTSYHYALKPSVGHKLFKKKKMEKALVITALILSFLLANFLPVFP